MKTTIDEQEYVRMILLLADIEGWIKQIQHTIFTGISAPAGKLSRAQGYRLGLAAMAHILERHYHGTLRHPGTGKFLVSLPELLDLIKEAGTATAEPIPGKHQLKRVLACDRFIGINKSGHSCSKLVVITEENGEIRTAFPE
jgi:hypothetical protein